MCSAGAFWSCCCCTLFARWSLRFWQYLTCTWNGLETSRLFLWSLLYHLVERLGFWSLVSWLMWKVFQTSSNYKAALSWIRSLNYLGHWSSKCHFQSDLDCQCRHSIFNFFNTIFEIYFAHACKKLGIGDLWACFILFLPYLSIIKWLCLKWHTTNK